jgi:hypothetical protein
MRIIPDGTHIIYAVIDKGLLDWSSGNPMYHQCDTIEITDKELDDLYHSFVGVVNKEFSQKLREFIELKIAEKEKK